ncbi:subtilase family serine protease [Kitasatospora sp. MAP12-15]|uniref:S53 family peptidase n=1 Tax=unclassified Kitasatospora TaxID=2633591 RepID=UPI002476764F|nr:S53 family peptidase [Kitasatospora sp. MAP12-44]MDH6114538.1 subtilase family serine protease [Kitasatospora sp. MAP12-44]
MRTSIGSVTRRTALALTAAAGLTLSGFAITPADAAPTADAHGHGHGHVSVTRSCAVPKKAGYLACNALRVTSGTPVKAKATGALAGHATAAAAVSGYGPADIQGAYNLASAAAANGAGETVAIVDAQDDPNAESDLAAYRSQFGLPACTSGNGCFTKVDENGGTNYPSPDSGWAGEISLDLDMVSATCPNCNILLVEATSASTDDLGTAVNQAVTLGAKFVSNSYGGSESADETTADNQYFNHPGVAITASAGDSGYGVEYPAASPYVTSVGGTSLTADSSARGWSESVWSTSSTEGTGSGCSAYEAKPSWQSDPGCANRTVADVSAVADPATGVAVYDTYGASGWNVYGGTSASSPIIASVYALAGNPGANTTPAADLYANPSALNDVTSGSNGDCGGSYLCTAGAGYDGPTGLGTPNGTAAFTG